MPQGDKSKYTDKQKRQAKHIEDSYEERGIPEGESAARAWATVNRQDHGGKLPGGSGRGTTPDTHPNGNGSSNTKKAAAKKAPADKAAAKKAPAAKKKTAGAKKKTPAAKRKASA